VGGVEEYLTRRRADIDAAPVFAEGPTTQAEFDGGQKAGDGGPTAGGGGRGAGEVRAARKELAKLERRLAKLAEQETTLHADLATHATDYTRVAALDAELREIRTERDRLEETWLELAESTP
jgi:ATP-binding cassette subfamily F protein uup